MKSNYCPYVYKGLRISFSQKDNKIYAISKPCCHVMDKEFPNSVQEYSVDNVLDDVNMQYFKNYFDNNDDLPSACESCKKLESVNQTSHRTRAINNEKDGYDIYKFDIVIGNTCNLACPFCSSYASSLINVLSHNYENEHKPEMWISRDGKYDASVDQTTNSIHEILSKYTCQSIKVIGGEPFLKENWSVFEDLLNNDFLKDSTLEITTNGTIMNQKILDSLAKTKKTIIRASVDSIGENYNFIRWPYNFEKLVKNLKFLSENKTPNIDLQISILVNVINFEYLPDIENLLDSYNNISVGYETLIKPAGQSMDWRYLPKTIVDDVCSKLRNKKLIALLKDDTLYINTENTTNTLKFLLKQRDMKAEDVFKFATKEHFNL